MMMDKEKLERFLVLRQWLHVGAGACTWCSARIAFVLVDKEIVKSGGKAEPPPSWGCAQRQECETRAKIFYPSMPAPPEPPAPAEQLTGVLSGECPECHDRAFVMLVGKRAVRICQKCRRQKLREASNGK